MNRSDPIPISIPGASCALWHQATPSLDGERLGTIGRFAAESPDAARALLRRAESELRALGCRIAAGPMDGDTWHAYRFATGGGDPVRPPFFMEPANPAWLPATWLEAGWRTGAEYFSAAAKLRGDAAQSAAPLEPRFADLGVAIRPLAADDFEIELRRIYAMSAIAFTRNFLYTPIPEAAFLSLYEKVKPLADPRFVFIAEAGGRDAGFLFAIPDPTAPGTLIVKTLAVVPDRRFAGLGTLLVAQAHAAAEHAGMAEVIHALMHESNQSRRISGRLGGETIRTYALFLKDLR